MKYIIAGQHIGADAYKDKFAAAGDPVIPNFPTGPRNTFLSIYSFLPALYGIATDIPEFSVEDFVERLATNYPGLPVELLRVYVMETCKLAEMLPHGTTVQPYLSDDNERLTVRVANAPDNTMGVAVDDIYKLWDEQPIPVRYK